MPFNINDFHSSISKTGGIAKQSDFDCFLELPPGLQGKGFTPEDLRFRIDTVSIPGRVTEQQQYKVYGEPHKIVTGATFADITMEVICSPDLRERELFMAWQDLMVGEYRVQGLDGEEVGDQFDIGYPKGDNGYYSAGVTINQYFPFEEIPEPVYRVKLIDAYPSNVGALPMNWAQPETQKLTINMSYRYFQDRQKDLPDFPDRRRQAGFLNRTGLGALLGTAAGQVAGRIGAKRTAAIMTAGQVIRNRL